MQAEFRAPKRRTRVYEEYEAPLPVSRIPEEKCHYRADLINQHVLVCSPDHIQRIYSQGYFGKGVLSRSRPDHAISDQWEQHEGLLLPVISQSRYEELLTWAGSALSSRGLDEQAVNQALQRLSEPIGIEDVMREMEEGGASSQSKRPLEGSGVKPEPKRSCKLDPDPSPDQEPESASDQEPNPKPNHNGQSSSNHNADPSSHQKPDPGSDQDPDSALDQDSNSDSDSDSDPCPDPDPLVPGSGYVLVVFDNEVKEMRQTPIHINEYLQLSLEEAFFLVYSLGCMSVYLDQEPLSIIQLWRKFRSLRPDFISSFVAYQHFRSKGWVPKVGSGAKYGVDLMLYRKGPPFYHASYSVAIERVDDTFRGSTLRPFTWRTLAALSRITSNVSKELMLCYIIYPADQSDAELDSPVCLSRLQVQEVIVSRWVSSRERAEQDDI